MGDDGDSCCTGLALGIGLGEYIPKFDRSQNKKVVSLDLSFPRHFDEEVVDIEDKKENKRSSIYDNENDNKNSSRKKLRLSKEQSSLLEGSFNLHNTLNSEMGIGFIFFSKDSRTRLLPLLYSWRKTNSGNIMRTTNNQKQALAEKLNLRPRQVEVWFQNRRARTKLKQTEVDCEYMKKCCEKLSEENQRLKKELHELLELKLRPLYIQLPKASSTLKMCPSCSCDDKNTSFDLFENIAKEEEEKEENGEDQPQGNCLEGLK